jgi:hypothetical protein
MTPIDSLSKGLTVTGVSWRALYLFAGKPRRNDIGHYVRAMANDFGITNFQFIEVDILRGGSEHDLTSRVHQEAICKAIENGYANSVFMSPPCETFSRVRYSNRRGPPPVRSSAYPWGFPWLSQDMAGAVEQANSLLKLCIRVLKCSSEAFATAILEHPEDLGATSEGIPASIWQLPEIRNLDCSLDGSITGPFHSWAVMQCDFGADYAKPTRFITNYSFKHPEQPEPKKAYLGKLSRESSCID